MFALGIADPTLFVTSNRSIPVQNTVDLKSSCVLCVWVILRSECGGTRWRTGGEVKGKLGNGGGNQYSHTTSADGVSSITNADAHTSAASSLLNWLPRRFKWTRPFRRKTKCGFCACAIRFRTSYNTVISFSVLCGNGMCTNLTFGFL